MDPIQNAVSSRKSSLFKIGDTEVRLIPTSSFFNAIASGHFGENKSKVSAKKERYYRCSECSYSTTWSGSFKRHFMCRHTDVKPYSCPECGYRTADVGNLKKHVTGRHTTERAFRCLACPYGTINLSHLRRHVANQHAGERAHPCPACPYAAGQASDLRKHLQARHPTLAASPVSQRLLLAFTDQQLDEDRTDSSYTVNERIYGCFHCDFSSKLLRKLKIHILGKHFPEK